MSEGQKEAPWGLAGGPRELCKALAQAVGAAGGRSDLAGRGCAVLAWAAPGLGLGGKPWQGARGDPTSSRCLGRQTWEHEALSSQCPPQGVVQSRVGTSRCPGGCPDSLSPHKAVPDVGRELTDRTQTAFFGLSLSRFCFCNIQCFLNTYYVPGTMLYT